MTNKLLELERAKKAAQPKDDKPSIAVHRIPVLENGALFIAVSGVKVDHAVLIIDGKEISYCFPCYGENPDLSERKILSFLGENVRLHKNLCKGKVEVEFHYFIEKTDKFPSLMLGKAKQVDVDWKETPEYTEDVVVHNAEGKKLTGKIVYMENLCGLRLTA